MSNSKRDIGADLESPFLDEQIVRPDPGSDETDQLESGDDEGTFNEEEAAESEAAESLEEIEAAERDETETAEEAERDDAESEDEEPEVSEACEEEQESSDEGAEAEWEDLEDTADEAAEFEPELLESEVWSGTANQIAFRDRVLAAHIARSKAARGAAQQDLRRAELKTIPGTSIETRADTADAAGRLLAAANADLAAAQKAGDADAQRTVRLTATSGYRSSAHQTQGESLDEAFSLEQEAGATARIQGRILWPALGFPAVIAPKAGSREAASMLVDATRCLTILVLTDKPSLSKAEVARYLRLVPWKERGRRYIPEGSAGSFREEQLVVRKARTDHNGEIVSFGGGSETDSVVVHLPAFVREQYAKARMTFFYEIRLSEEVCAGLAGTSGMTLFHVFWNNHRAGEDVPSDEMALLLKSVAPANREKDAKVWVGSAPAPQLRTQWRQKWDRLLPGLLREYEYGVLSEAERQKSKPSKVRAEILHPVFVMKAAPRPLRIAHVTDLHVDVRWDIFEERLKSVAPQVKFNNSNRSSLAIYRDATGDAKADVVLMTGDLIDYGRGHRGLAEGGKLGENKDYLRDRNWFLFQELLASGDRYTRPVFTSLGNHDWRLNPYPPFVPGAPNFQEFVHNFASFKKEQIADWIRKSHGDNHDARFSYDPRWKHVDLRDFVKILGKAITASETLEDEGLPSETHVDSIAWYLLTINSFLDYRCELPGGYRLLMLDFGKREFLLIHDTRLGQNYAYVHPGDGQSRGPRALSCLTKTQQWMVSQFLELPGKAKVIGIHTPPLGPYPDWSETGSRARIQDVPQAARSARTVDLSLRACRWRQGTEGAPALRHPSGWWRLRHGRRIRLLREREKRIHQGPCEAVRRRAGRVLRPHPPQRSAGRSRAV